MATSGQKSKIEGSVVKLIWPDCDTMVSLNCGSPEFGSISISSVVEQFASKVTEIE